MGALFKFRLPGCGIFLKADTPRDNKGNPCCFAGPFSFFLSFSKLQHKTKGYGVIAGLKKCNPYL
jgi:hypothetical protein